MLLTTALTVNIACWVAWMLAFVKPRKLAAGQKKVARAPLSRWGIGLKIVGFAFIWTHVRPVGFDKSESCLIASITLGPPAVALVWAATRHLGKQWRYEAALSEDHELIQTGPYRWVRHPIYTSMLVMLLATAAAWTWWPMFVAGLIFFLIGNEIRVRAEDGLLAERFGSAFTAYRSRSGLPAIRPLMAGG